MKQLFVFGLSMLAGVFVVMAQAPVKVLVNAQLRGYAIDPHFCGVSIFTHTQEKDHRGMPGNLFSPDNKEMVALFRNSGIKHLRLGATGARNSASENLNRADIDALFAFAKATDMKVIYSLHGQNAAATAKYVWENYRPWLDYFAFDNEPDKRAERFFEDWRIVAKEVLAVAPGAKFAGPDAAGRSLVPQFVKKVKDMGCLELVTQHIYVGGNSRKKGIDVAHGVDLMLSKNWLKDNYPALYRSVCHPVMKEGLGYRLTESDDFVHGITNASDTYAAALWALDYAHWWARHGATGVNFQNTEWLPTDTFFVDAQKHYQVHPKAYGIRAFELGSHGRTEPVTIENPRELNVTAYGVGDDTNCCVTIINKEHGANASAAKVTVSAFGFEAKKAEAMFLRTADGNVTASSGVTLGGDSISNHATWKGKWKTLKLAKDGKCEVDLAAASAVVVRFSTH